MAGNDTASASAAMDDSSVTMLDVLNNENQLEEESEAVLGGSDAKNCTFSKVKLFFLIILEILS